MAGRDSKRRKISHPWLDLEAQVALEDEDGEDVWEIGTTIQNSRERAANFWLPSQMTKCSSRSPLQLIPLFHMLNFDSNLIVLMKSTQGSGRLFSNASAPVRRQRRQALPPRKKSERL